MSKNEITEFIQKSIEQIKSGLSGGLELGGNFDFEISVVTEKYKGGRIGIHIANAGIDSRIEQIHKIKFSIIDEKSREKNIQQIRKVLKELKNELS